MPVPLFKPGKKRVIQNRGAEIFVAIVLTIAATYLFYDAFDWRGKEMPWPFSGIFWG